MASTYSDLKFELIGTGEQSGTWGTTTNTNLGTAIEEAITGSADVTFASATVTLTLTDTNASQTARNLRLNLTGTSGGAQDLIVPAIEKFYIVNNGCADTITVKVSGQTGVGVPAGKAMLLFNNGTDVVNAVNHFDSVTLTTALAVASGGTGATTALGATQNLGVEVGVDVQAYDAGLTDIAGLAVTDGNFIVGDGTNWVAESGATARTSLGAQAADQALTDISGLAVTDGNFIVGDGTNWVAESGATARTSLGLGTLATLNEVDAATIQDNSVGAAELNVPGNGTAGQFLQSDGDGSMTWAAAGGGFSSIQVFTSPGTWTNPGSVTKVKVTVVGGGGGGSAGFRSPVGAISAGSGGGGGGAAIEIIPFPSATNVPVTIGAGGSGATSAPATGGTGGTSSFGPYCSATGGSGSNSNPGYTVGSGGTGSGGDLNLSGQGGGQITSSPGVRSGSGGASLFQGGGTYQATGNPGSTLPGNAGTNGGGGGGGVSAASNGTTAPGGAGGAGVVIVEY